MGRISGLAALSLRVKRRRYRALERRIVEPFMTVEPKPTVEPCFWFICTTRIPLLLKYHRKHGKLMKLSERIAS